MTSEYKCPTCGINDPDAFNRCNHPACPDGRDIGNRRNTRAMPDVPELVTVGYQYELHIEKGQWRHYLPLFTENYNTRELVERFQAAEIIAAKDAEIELLENDHADVNQERARWKQRAEAAEAELVKTKTLLRNLVNSLNGEVEEVFAGEIGDQLEEARAFLDAPADGQ